MWTFILFLVVIDFSFGQWPATNQYQNLYQYMNQYQTQYPNPNLYQNQYQNQYQNPIQNQIGRCQNICTLLQRTPSPLCANERGILKQYSSQCELAMYNCQTNQMLVARTGYCPTQLVGK